jgi:hypothetical protein
VVILAAAPLINRLRHPPSVDFKLTGGLVGTMNQLASWHQASSTCSTDRKTNWGSVFIGRVGADRMALTILVMPYRGPATYSVGPFDPQRATPVPVHVLLSRLPDSGSSTVIPPIGAKVYRTEPNSSNSPPLPPTAGQHPVGQTVFVLNADEKSGQIDAPLYSWSGEAPIRVSGSFNCGLLTTP